MKHFVSDAAQVPSGTLSGPEEFALLFDMDGVIVEGHGADPVVHSLALEDLLEEREMDVPDRYRAPLEQYEYTDEFVAACEAVGVDPHEFYTARERYSAEHSIDRLAAGKRGVFGDVDAIDRLADHAAVGLVSNNYHPTVEFVVDHHRLDAFRYVRGRDFGPDGFSRRKPNPHYLNEALDALGVTDGLYVGDRATDVVAAERAGIDSAFLRRDHNADADLDVDPTLEIDGLGELADLVAE
ncbi:HAD family hydrolase [Halobellus ordinarius]|uniref:HAD family hydrolase n=1 Tax=Halobellus ordinarius TaxID=3075120 RepID=UPI0028807EA9|nr:HAD-IA family hydrolase [Halobellus sp. ZY16]